MILSITIIFNILNETKYVAAIEEEYSFINKWSSHGDSNGEFEEPTGIAIDSSNNVYVSDMDFENCCNPLHHTVQKFTDEGVLLQNGVAMEHSLILWESL